jgi:hypothetical protein
MAKDLEEERQEGEDERERGWEAGWRQLRIRFINKSNEYDIIG